jgi:REP element-mobilizing transposase RayT
MDGEDDQVHLLVEYPPKVVGCCERLQQSHLRAVRCRVNSTQADSPLRARLSFRHQAR